MKNSYDNFYYKWILGFGMFCAVLIIPEMWIAKLITQNHPGTYDTCITRIVFVTLSIYMIVAIIKSVQFFKYIEQHNQEKLEKSKITLDSDFKTVLLKSSSNIPAENFVCQAKIDDDGKIICKISLDYQTILANYEEFNEYFYFDKK